MRSSEHFSRSTLPVAVFLFVISAIALAAQAQVVFSPPMSISNPSGNAKDQQLAVDFSGNINLVWADNSLGNYAIFFTRTSDSGATFSTPQSISRHAQSAASGPRMAVDSSGGNVDIVWTETSPDGTATFVYFSHSSDGGATFTNPQNISGDAGAATNPRMAVDSNGNVNVVWVDTSAGNPEIFFSGSADGGVTFSAPLNISNDSGNSISPAIAVDSGGNINVAWSDDTPGFPYDVFFTRSADGGASFSAPLQVTHSNKFVHTGPGPVIASPPNGNIDLQWTQQTPLGAFVAFSRSTDAGTTFPTPFSLLNFADSVASSVGMALDPSGNTVGVVGQVRPTEEGRPFAAIGYSPDAGASFPGRARLSVFGTASSNPQIVVDAIGRLDATYAQNASSPGQVSCLCFVQSADGVELSGVSTITSFVPTTPAAMAVDSAGNVSVAWLQNASAGGNASVFFSRATVPPFSFSMSPIRLLEGDSSTGAVKLITPAPSGGATISLSSTNPSLVSVPASVTVPEGAGSVTFAVTAGAVQGFGPASISASLNGSAYTSTLFVDQLFQLSGFFGNIAGGNTVSGEIVVSRPAPSGGLVVDLSSSDSSVASVPTSVTVPAGSQTATFSILTSSVTAPTTVQITGSANGFIHSGPLAVQPSTLAQLSLSLTNVTGGNFTTLTVSLDGPAPAGGSVVSLSNNNPSVVNAPASITIPAGSTSASVNVSTNPVSGGFTKVILSASLNGVTQSVFVFVLGGPLEITGWVCVQPPSCQVSGGTTITASAGLTGQAPSGGLTIAFSSSNPSVVSVPASVTIPEGASSATFTMTTSPVAVSTQVQVSETVGGQSAGRTIFVNP